VTHMRDDVGRWLRVLDEVAAEQMGGDGLVAEIDDLCEGVARSSTSRAGTGGDPLTSRDAGAYDDIDDDEKTVGECDEADDPIAEALAMTLGRAGRLTEDETMKKRRISAFRSIRSTLESVWGMLGKAETRLGIASFDADTLDMTEIEQTLAVLVKNVKEIMSRIETARERIGVQ
jgi:hypothetical protein